MNIVPSQVVCSERKLVAFGRTVKESSVSYPVEIEIIYHPLRSVTVEAGLSGPITAP